MTDHSTATLARYCVELTTASVPATALEDARLLIVDTLGCLVGGWDSPPARVAQELARRERSARPARVLGTPVASTVESAGFANTVAARYLDYNDAYQGVGTGHPSDMIPGLLSLAESRHASGEELVLAVLTGYEAFGALAKVVPIRDTGFDQGVLIGIGEAAGAAKLLGLDQARYEQALGLVATMCVPTRSTRSGRLFMWKGAATAAAVKLGLFAARLAEAGMTGPDEPIEGRHGLWEQVTGQFAVRPFGGGDPWSVSTTSLKFWAAESTSHGPLEMVRDLRGQAALEQIEHLAVRTYWNCWHEIGSEPEKWSPDTRETADHSLPFIMAACLVDGYIDRDSFDAAHLADPRIRELMKKTTIDHAPEYTALWPDEIRSSLVATLTDGRELAFSVSHPKGHPRNPGTPADIEDKFRINTVKPMGEAASRAALEALADLRSVPDVASIVDSFVVAQAG